MRLHRSQTRPTINLRRQSLSRRELTTAQELVVCGGPSVTSASAHFLHPLLLCCCGRCTVRATLDSPDQRRRRRRRTTANVRSRSCESVVLAFLARCDWRCSCLDADTLAWPGIPLQQPIPSQAHDSASHLQFQPRPNLKPTFIALEI